MSLQTDTVFVKAIRANASLIGQLAARDVYNTAIALPDEDADNAPLPYVIVTYDGMNSDVSTKDSSFDGLSDMVDIGVTIAARKRPELAEIAVAVRRAVLDYFSKHADEDSLIPDSYTVHAQSVQYDSLKPCYWQSLTFKCVTSPDL